MQFGCQSISHELLALPGFLLSLVLPITFYSDHSPINLPALDDDDGKCELIGTFSLLTQAFLGLLCLSSLIMKRFYEYPLRRSWSVWSFDVSKQLIGAFGVHIFNVLLSIFKTQDYKDPGLSLTNADDYTGSDSNDDSSEDPCDWYFLNIVFDCTIGVYILYLVFKYVNRLCKDYLHFTQIESGQYGPDPKNPSFKAFLKQLSIYFTSLMITKFILYGIVECFETQLLWFTGHVLLVWLNEYPDEFEIFIVMFVVPVVMNCLQLVLIDNFIQNQIVHRTNLQAHHSSNSIPRLSSAEEEITRLLTNSELDHGIKHHRTSKQLQLENDLDKTGNSSFENDDPKFQNYGSLNDDNV